GLLNPPKWVEYAVMVFFVAFVCVLSKWIVSRRKAANSIEQGAVTDAAV
ncbi:MAG: TerC family protein, partial [Deltaproteobacteria bacterium]|nr:TerC family protein [Deltaproteobacteria bacterium]